MVTLTKCFNVQEALMLKSRLESAGLHPLLPDELTMEYGLPFLIDTVGIRVQVPEAEVEAAKLIMKEAAEAKADAEPGGAANGDPGGSP